MSFTGQRHTESALKKCSESKLSYWLSKNGTEEERLFARIDRKGNDECWPWTSSKTRSGYGKWSFRGKHIPPHRMAFEIDIGYFVPKELEACHHCDNRSCCNPSHIYVATHKSNMEDASKKKRWSVNPRRKIVIKIFRGASAKPILKRRKPFSKMTEDQKRICFENRSKTAKMPMPEKFWMHVKKSSPEECWLWLGTKSNGYGEITIDGVRHRAHRLSWELTNGRTIENGLWARHTCDNPPCVNPDHIIPGTPKENMQDMVRKGRKNPVHGELHPRSVLTDSAVREIRDSFGIMSLVSIARQYGVSLGSINGIKHGRNWKHVI